MIALCDGAFFLPWYGRFFDPIRFRNRRNNKTRIDRLTGTGLLLDSGLYLRQILVLFKHGAFVPDMGSTPPQPRPIYGIFVAITVMNCTFASSDRLAM